MLEAFTSKITNDMLCEWHYHIGDNMSDEYLPEKVIQFLMSRPWRVYSHPDRGKLPDPQVEEKAPEEVERETGQVAQWITVEIQQQETAACLCPLIESGRCKRDFSHPKKDDCFKGCNNLSPHPESECEYFLGLSVTKRRQLCRKWRRCYKCFAKGHDSEDCRSTLVEELHPLLSLRSSGKPKPISAGCASAASTSTGSSVMVPAQVILDPSGDRCTAMFDTGSQIT